MKNNYLDELFYRPLMLLNLAASHCSLHGRSGQEGQMAREQMQQQREGGKGQKKRERKRVRAQVSSSPVSPRHLLDKQAWQIPLNVIVTSLLERMGCRG